MSYSGSENVFPQAEEGIEKVEEDFAAEVAKAAQS